MKYIATIVLVLAVEAGIGLIGIYSGWFNVAADVPDSGFTHWVLHTTMEKSVAKRAPQVGPAPNLDDEALIKTGARDYRKMCMGCHLAPGMKATDVHRGLHPTPPKLFERTEHVSPKTLFWVVKHGVRMTAMPAWGKTQSDKTLWSIVAFLRVLPHLSPQQFNNMTQKGGSAGAQNQEQDASS